MPCEDNTICKTFINKAVYNNDTVYYTSLSGELCDPVFSATLLNNNGDVVKKYDLNSVDAFNKDVIQLNRKNSKTLYYYNSDIDSLVVFKNEIRTEITKTIKENTKNTLILNVNFEAKICNSTVYKYDENGNVRYYKVASYNSLDTLGIENFKIVALYDNNKVVRIENGQYYEVYQYNKNSFESKKYDSKTNELIEYAKTENTCDEK